jgi:hypothetical protein
MTVISEWKKEKGCGYLGGTFKSTGFGGGLRPPKTTLTERCYNSI